MDYKKAVKEKKDELQASGLTQRMDADADLVNLSKYTLKDADNKKLPNAVSVTLNDPAVFAANVESSLGNAVERIAVESEDKKLDTAKIEDAIRAAFMSANRRRQMRGEWPLNPVFDQYMCRRGGGAARCLVYEGADGQPVFDITPWDRRYTYYSLGVDGLDWAAYETSRSKDDILSEYPEEKYPEAKVSGKKATVLDIWDKEKNYIYIGDKKIDERENEYGFVPVCIQLVPMGSMLVEKANLLKFQGESIFFLIRDLIPELNRLASIMQSMNLKELDHALQEKSEAGKGGTAPEYDDVTKPGTIVEVDKGGGFEPIPFGQLRQSALWLHEMIETRIQRGSLSNFDYGTFSQPMSAVALIQVGEGRDQVFLPRLGARGLLNQQLALMMIEQLDKLGVNSVDIGVRGHKRTFNLSELKGEYDVEFKYFVKSPTIDMARIEAATAAKNSGLYSGWTARREIAQQQDPEEEERRISWEEIENLVPAIKLRRNIKDLYDMADDGDDEARIDAQLAEEVLMTLIGQTGQPQQMPRREGEMMELLAKETKASPSGGSARQAAQLKKTPVEEE